MILSNCIIFNRNLTGNWLLGLYPSISTSRKIRSLVKSTPVIIGNRSQAAAESCSLTDYVRTWIHASEKNISTEKSFTSRKSWRVAKQKEQFRPMIKQKTALSLVEKAKKHDRSAMETLYNRHYYKLFRIAVSLVSNKENAEEIVNDSFITAFNRLETLRKPESFESWLTGIALNLIRNKRRKTSNAALLTYYEEHANRQAEENPLLSILIERAINSLPEGYRTVFLLHDRAGFTHEEICKITGCSIGTSKSQLFKARRQLRKALSSEASVMETVKKLKEE